MENNNLAETDLSENETISESFDGLKPEEKEKIKALGIDAMENYQKAVKGYEEILGSPENEKPQ